MTEIEYFLIIGSLITFVLISSIISFLFYNQRKHFEYKSEKESMKTNFQKSLLETQIEIQEQTLKNISQEIHDNIGQTLTLAKLNLTTQLIKNPSLPDSIKNSHSLIAKAIQDLRNLSHNLNTDFVEQMGLVRCVESELESLQNSGTMQTRIKIEGKVQRLDSKKELILYRIIQESIQNAIKHSEANKLQVRFNFTLTNLQVCICDNGKGFEPELFNNGSKTGIGLNTLKSRSTMIDAQITIKSSLGNGTEISINIPFNN